MRIKLTVFIIIADLPNAQIKKETCLFFTT